MTTTTTGITTTLLTCLAQHLEDAGVGNWDPDGTYTTDTVGIYLKALPGTETDPDTALALTAYGVDDTPTWDEDTDGGRAVTIGVQVRARGTRDPRVVDDLTDATYRALHNATGLTLGTDTPLPVALIWRVSLADLGPDDEGRWETTQNFYAHTTRPFAL